MQGSDTPNREQMSGIFVEIHSRLEYESVEHMILSSMTLPALIEHSIMYLMNKKIRFKQGFCQNLRKSVTIHKIYSKPICVFRIDPIIESTCLLHGAVCCADKIVYHSLQTACSFQPENLSLWLCAMMRWTIPSHRLAQIYAKVHLGMGLLVLLPLILLVMRPAACEITKWTHSSWWQGKRSYWSQDAKWYYGLIFECSSSRWFRTSIEIYHQKAEQAENWKRCDWFCTRS